MTKGYRVRHSATGNRIFTDPGYDPNEYRDPMPEAEDEQPRPAQGAA